jgi:putative oxidoreductase
MSTGMLLIRVVVGLTFAAHGAQKLFGWFEGYGIAGTGAFMEQLGFRPGWLHATSAGLGEFVGGLLLALGLLTPLAAALCIAVMLVAVMTVHLPKGFFVQKGGFEYNLVLASAALAVAWAGPGDYSLDRVFGLDASGDVWGLASLGLAVVGTVLQLLTRRPPVPAPAKP